MTTTLVEEPTSTEPVGTQEPGPDAGLRSRLRTWLVSLALVVVAFRQGSGLVLPDTKFDLVEDPAAWLASGISLWDPGAAFGQLQNQAYGYLFPMGPFFWLGDLAHLPDWVTQRLWWSLLLVVAFIGMSRLLERLDIGSPWVRVVAGVLYALSPRIQSELGTISIESWPVALAAWILLPLVRPRSPWVAAGTSALAVAALGGVNAVASGAALFPAAIWLLTRRPSRALFGLMWRWAVCVALATAWWVVPLLMLGRYSPPFLDWIEDARVTTSGASVFEALRGTSHWLPYLADGAGPVWGTGWSFLTQPALVLQTVLVVAVAFYGLARRGMPERGFVVVLLLAGVALLTLGHVGAGGAWYAEWARTLLDGPLAPMRNTHKFDLLVRMAVCLAVAHGLTGLRLTVTSPRVSKIVVLAVTLPVVLGAVAPALTGALVPRGAYTEVPQYWRDAAGWLDTSEEPGSVLVLPGVSSARFTWGTTADEPLQAMMSRPLVVRDSVPLGSAGSTRLLDAVQDAVEGGRGSDGLRETLARVGVGFVLVRADLAATTDAPPPLAVRQALVDSGLEKVAEFGPVTGSAAESAGSTLNERLLQPVAAIEVYAVPGAADSFELMPASATLRASGGAEDLISLADAGLLDGRIAFLGGDGAAVPDYTPISVQTDGLRKRETSFGRTRNHQSQTLTPDDEGRSGRVAREPLIDDDPDRATVALPVGIEAVTTSSSGADAGATLRTGPGDSGWSAVDDDARTRWVSGSYAKAVGEWIEVRTTDEVDPGSMTVQLSTAPPVATGVTQVRVETDAGSLVAGLMAGEAPQTVSVPKGPTRRIRMVVTEMASGTPNGVAVTTLAVPGVEAGRTLRLPTLADRGPLAAGAAPTDALLFRAATARRDGCLVLGLRPLCSTTLQRAGEEDAGIDRTFSLDAPAAYDLSGSVRALPGPSLDRLLTHPGAMSATATSTGVDGAGVRPSAAVDRDLGTGWVADPDDLRPVLTVTLPEAREVSGFQVQVDAAMAASRPSQVTVDLGSAPQTVDVDEEGYVRVPPETTSQLTIAVDQVTPLLSTDSGSGIVTVLPAGISELQVLGADDLRREITPDTGVSAVCGYGPTIVVDGEPVRTQVVGTVADVIADRPLSWERCGATRRQVELAAGEHRIQAMSTGEFAPATLTLTRETPPLPPTPLPEPEVEDSTATTARLQIGDRSTDAVLSMPQNHNVAWTASADGVRLEPVRVDGWRQGWVLPAGGSTTVDLSFAPQRTFTAALAVGALLAMVLVGGVLLTRRRLGRHAVARLPRLPARSAPRTVWLGLAAVAVLGGWAGALAVAVVALGAVAAQALAARRGVVLPPWAAAAVVPGLWTLAGLLAAAATWPGAPAGRDSAVVQVLALIGVSVIVVRAVGRSPRLPHRIMGRSSDGD